MFHKYLTYGLRFNFLFIVLLDERENFQLTEHSAHVAFFVLFNHNLDTGCDLPAKMDDALGGFCYGSINVDLVRVIG